MPVLDELPVASGVVADECADRSDPEQVTTGASEWVPVVGLERVGWSEVGPSSTGVVRQSDR
jgi:hypothetical protein